MPSSDDYGYAIWTHQAWESSHSLLEVIKQAVFTSKHFWNQWQGLYSSAFILAFMPNIFGEGAYAVTAFITIASVVAGNTVFVKAFSRKVLKADRVETCIVVVVINLLILQWMPSTVDAFYSGRNLAVFRKRYCSIDWFIFAWCVCCWWKSCYGSPTVV